MAEENEKEEEKKEAAPKPKKDIKKILGLVFVLINIIGGGGAVYLTYASTIGYQADPITDEIEKIKYAKEIRFLEGKPIVYSMDPFVVNLVGKNRKSIQIEMSLEMVSEEGYEEVITKTTEARDKIVKILNEKKFVELESIQGKLLLKDQIIASLNRYLTKGVVKGVYFTNLVVQ